MMLPFTASVNPNQLIPAGSRVLYDGHLVTLIAYSHRFEFDGYCLVALDNGRQLEARYLELAQVAHGPDQVFLFS